MKYPKFLNTLAKTVKHPVMASFILLVAIFIAHITWSTGPTPWIAWALVVASFVCAIIAGFSILVLEHKRQAHQQKLADQELTHLQDLRTKVIDDLADREKSSATLPYLLPNSTKEGS